MMDLLPGALGEFIVAEAIAVLVALLYLYAVGWFNKEHHAESQPSPEHHEGCCDPALGCGPEFGCDCRACEWYDRCCCECRCGRKERRTWTISTL